MSRLNVSVCNHTGMATLLIINPDDKIKMDLMPDEIKEARAIALENPDHLKAFISEIDPAFAGKLEAFSNSELQEGLLHPKCDI